MKKEKKMLKKFIISLRKEKDQITFALQSDTREQFHQPQELSTEKFAIKLLLLLKTISIKV